MTVYCEDPHDSWAHLGAKFQAAHNDHIRGTRIRLVSLAALVVFWSVVGYGLYLVF